MAARAASHVVERGRNDIRSTVVFASDPAFKVVAANDAEEPVALSDDPLYRATAVGISSDGRSSTDHDEVLYDR